MGANCVSVALGHEFTTFDGVARPCLQACTGAGYATVLAIGSLEVRSPSWIGPGARIRVSLNLFQSVFMSVLVNHPAPAFAFLAVLAVLSTPAMAAEEPAACRTLDDSASRLACYDRAVGREATLGCGTRGRSGACRQCLPLFRPL